MLVKNWLVPHITSIDFSCVDQIWVKLSFYPKVEIGRCYITPHDSPFYSHQSVAHIQEKILSNSDMDYILIGDLNCRFGNLLDSLQLPAGWKRGVSVDNRQQPYFNGRNMFHVFRDCGLIPINNISSCDRSFKGNFTFRMRQRWISELDWCVCTPNVLSFISDMAINNDIALPSNHAPLSVEFKFPYSLESLIQRAEDLLGHAHEINQLKKESMCRRPRKVQAIKYDDIASCLATLEHPNFHEDINIYSK